jgi:isoleucyl-tRNA synthetase
MDRWVLSQLNALVGLANERLEAYDVAALVEAVDRFVDDLSTWYLRRGRRRFSRAAEPADREAAFSTLSECLVTLARVVAPIMPFLAEEMYQNLVRSHDPSAPASVHLTPYPVPKAARIDPAVDEEMELARAIVALGRAARSEAGIRVRQPLPAITFATRRHGFHLSEEIEREIADELNVKDVHFALEMAEFARGIVRPNPKLLGPRLGKKFPEVAKALQEGEGAIEEDGSVSVVGERLAPEEFTITLEPLDQGSAIRWDGDLAVGLDATVTPELLAEGRARELVHRVQTMRRDAGLSVGDRITLSYRGSAAWREVVRAYEPRIREEVGAVEIREDGQGHADASDDASRTTWAGELDGEEIALALRQVS